MTSTICERPPAPGTLMRDMARGVWGEFMAVVAGEVYLRPVGGGREWVVSPEYVRRASYREAQRILGGRRPQLRQGAE
jgi:hypothetical protein